MHRLVLEAVEPALGRRVVPAVPFPAHRAGPAVRLELVLKGRLAYGLPRSEGCIKPDAGFLRNQARVSASITMSSVILGLSEQPTTSLLNKSRTMAR
jgi:hypothetical protein